MPPPAPDLKKLAIKLGTDGPVRVLPTPRLIQLLFNGLYILRTTKSSLVWEHPFYPQLYFPRSELVSPTAAHSALEVTEGEEYATEDGKVVGTRLRLSVGGRTIEKVVAFSGELEGSEGVRALRGLVRVEFGEVERWFEEDTPIFVHPKDPFKRVDVLQSGRRVRVTVGGQVVADATSSMHLYETGLPVRYYMPLTAIDASVLRPSKTRTECPYKGEAEYYSVEVDGKLHEDIVWYYTRPLLESAKIEGLCCFYNEKVQIELDGEILEQPVTHFGKHKPSDNVKPSAL